MSSKLYAGTGLVLAAILFFAVNILASTSFPGAHLDLTEHGLFTLSGGTAKTLQRLDEPVTLRLYLSRELATRLPSIAGYASRVQALLEEYERAAEGKLNVVVIDPEPFSEEEDRAVSYGLQGIPLSDGESTFYFGLVGTNALDDLEVIPYLSPERGEFIEYDVTKLVHTLGNPDRQVIGLLSTLPLDGMTPQSAMTGRPPQPWRIMEQIEQLFEVRRLGTDVTSIDEDVDVLMLVHPKGLTDATLYAIDQFVLRGGRALVFVDPHAEADTTQGIRGLPPLPQASELRSLLPAWGVDFDAGHVVGDLELAIKVRSGQAGRSVTVDYPVWMNVPPQLQNSEDIVTADIGNLTLASPGALEPVADAGTTLTPLVWTTEAAMKVTPDLIGPMADIENLLRVYEPSGRSFVLAARVHGRARSAFPEGPPPPPEEDAAGDEAGAAGEEPGAVGEEPGAVGEEPGAAEGEAAEAPAAAHLAQSAGDINVVVVGDTDLLQDEFWVRFQEFLGTRLAVPVAANATLVTNALDNLSGSEDLINVRSRGGFLRPFTRVNALRREAELKFREKETQLLEKLEATERRLRELQTQQSDAAGQLVLSPAQHETIAKFRAEKVQIRKELREVRRELRKNIERLEGGLKFANIGLVPILIGMGGLLIGVHRLRRRRPRAAPAGSAASPS